MHILYKMSTFTSFFCGLYMHVVNSCKEKHVLMEGCFSAAHININDV